MNYMGIMMSDINTIIEKCYVTDNVVSSAIDNVNTVELKTFLKQSALLFKNLGDHLFIASVLNGGRVYFENNNKNQKSLSWVDKNSFHTHHKYYNYYEVAMDGHRRALDELEYTIKNTQVQDDVQQILIEGMRKLEQNMENGFNGQ